MKLRAVLIFFMLCSGALNTFSNQRDWVLLHFKNGDSATGYVVQVTGKNFHLVSSSTNRLIPKDQLTKESQTLLARNFHVTNPQEPTTASSPSSSLLHDQQGPLDARYLSVSDLYSPRPVSQRPYWISPHRKTYFSHSYYLPQGYSLTYPVYQHHYRPYHRFPRWSIQIDL